MLMALLSCLGFSSALYAVPSWFNGPVQDGPPPLRVMPMPWNIFERQQFTHAGGSVGFDPWLWDDQLQDYYYGLQQGDMVGIFLHDAATGSYITHGSLIVTSEDGLCWSDGFQEHCGYFGGLYIAFFQRCLPEDQRVRVSGYFNNHPLGHGDFAATPFHPMVSEITMPAILEPRRTKHGQGQHGEVTARVRDDIGCNEVISDAKVHIASTIAESHTNGQIYFTKGDVGTGRFIALNGNDELNPGGEHERDTVIEGDTNTAGLFRTRYQALHHGAEELFTFTARRPATETRREIVGEKVLDNRLDIAIQGLVRITEANAPLGFADAGGCPHDPKPHWLTSNTRSRVMAIAAMYNYRTGRLISLNDGSLMRGGVIANRGGNGRDAPCHGSHRQGVDIDFNQVDLALDESGSKSGGENMRETLTEVNGDEVPLLVLVDTWAERMGGETFHTTNSIHYRFPD